MGPGTADVQHQLEQILRSAPFLRSERLSRFLRYCVQETLQGRATELKEYTIGVKVFDRAESFDPRLENIVRVEARRLRLALTEYYASTGRDDMVLIELPKGSYVPVFADRPTPVPVQRHAWNRASVLYTAAAVLLLAALLPYLVSRKRASTSVPISSIAVLPFANLTGDPKQEYFTDGLTDEIISVLTNVPRLKVVGRTSSFEFKGRAQDVRRIGERLNAAAVLDGAVRMNGTRLRVSAQLVRTEDGYHLWSETYERNITDILAVQQDLARNIVRKVTGRSSGEAESRLVVPGNSEAYKSYLKGRFFWYKWRPDSVQKSTGYFLDAIARDPNYAPAYAGLADAYGLLAHWGVGSPRELSSKRDEALQRALHLDANLVEARVALAMKKAFYDWNWAAAEDEFRRALAINPRWPEAHRAYAVVLIALGRFDEAQKELDQALALDPLSEFLNANRGWVHYNRRSYDRAIEVSRDALDMHPAAFRAYLTMGAAYTEKRMFPEAVRALQEAQRLAPGNPEVLAVLAHTYGRSGDRREAYRIFEQLVSRGEARRVSPIDIATVYLGVADTERALAALETAYTERDGRLSRLKVGPIYDPLRTNPRFRKLLNQIGLGT